MLFFLVVFEMPVAGIMRLRYGIRGGEGFPTLETTVENEDQIDTAGNVIEI